MFSLIFLLLFTQHTSGRSAFTTVCDNRVVSNGNETGGICYEESLTDKWRQWDFADYICQFTGRSLARILTEETSDELEKIIQDTDEYWIGLSREGSNSGFMWSDGSSLSYERWSSCHPIDGMNCVSVRGDSREWYSSNCSDYKPYICERDVCVSWIVRNGICYKRFEGTMTAGEAVSLCESQNSYLQEIPNIYVNNIITEVIGENECWSGLRTNATHYYWRIGDFPLGEDVPADVDECGTVDSDNGNRWKLRNCSIMLCAICMVGPLTNEAPVEKCESSSADNLVYGDSCYTLITEYRTNLDIATLTCNGYYNGTLYELNNTTVNVELNAMFGESNTVVVCPDEFSTFTPQDGYFNLLTSNDGSNYTENPDCVRIYSDGLLSASATCPLPYIRYICKRAYTTHTIVPPTSTSTFTPTTATSTTTTPTTATSTASTPTTATSTASTPTTATSTTSTPTTATSTTSTPTTATSTTFTPTTETSTTFTPTTATSTASTSTTATSTTFTPTTATSTASTPTTATSTTTTPTTMMIPSETICSGNSTIPVCVILLNSTYDPNMEMDPLIQRENYLESLSEDLYIETGQVARVYREELEADILVTTVDSNINTTLSFDNVRLEINNESFENDSIVTSAVYQDNSEFTSAANIQSPVITIVSSERLRGELTIIFSLTTERSEGNLTCSSYNDNSKWISDGISTAVTENAISCTTNHLTTFAVTLEITISRNETVNCSDPLSNNSSFCDILDNPSLYQSENTSEVQLLQGIDEYLKNLVVSLKVTTGLTLVIVQPRKVLVIIGLRVNSTTSVAVGDNAVTANPNSFPADTVLAVLSISFNNTREFTNDSVRIVSDIITIQASNELNGTLTIEFIVRIELTADIPENPELQCVFLTSDGEWSGDGIKTIIISDIVECVTEHLTTFALLSSTSVCDVDIGEINKSLIRAASYTLLSLSLLFLIASLIVFLVSWRKVFRLDINIMNFNHSISLSLAIFVSIFGSESFTKTPIICHSVAFLLHFFWTNIFLSSLSISILVFYSIWIVGINHLARRLSPYLIPISWSLSAVWAVIWLGYGIGNNNYINTKSQDNPSCEEPCSISTRSNLIFALIVPIIVIILINLSVLLLDLLKIRQAFKKRDRHEKELVRLWRVAFGGLLLVPSLGLPFFLSIPLSFSHLFKEHIPLYLILYWANLLTTAPIGILHFFLVTYQTPEASLPTCIRSDKGKQLLTADTSLPSHSLPLSISSKPASLNFNVIRPKPKVNGAVLVIQNELDDSEV